MTVQQLINELQRVKNKELEVFTFWAESSDIFSVYEVDDTITDRVDLNIDRI